MPAALEIFNLTRYYGTFPAVDHISFHVEKGSVFGLLGPNGAGKSTTLKMLTTLLPPSDGDARIDGYDLISNPEGVRAHIGYVPQLVSADGELTGYENLDLSAKLYGLWGPRRKERIHEVLNFMGMQEYANKLVKQYSGGMVRRLEIAQAILHNPSVLFFDEPTVGLDPAARKSLWTHIEEWRKRFNTTMLLTTHDMDEADRLCDIVAFMYKGKIVIMDTPAKLKATLGPQATLDDVFIHYTGASIAQNGDLSDTKQLRQSIYGHD